MSKKEDKILMTLVWVIGGAFAVKTIMNRMARRNAEGTSEFSGRRVTSGSFEPRNIKGRVDGLEA